MRSARPAPPATIDAYIASFPPSVRAALRQVRAAIRAAAPDATEAIKYRMPTYVLGENLVHFAAFARHVGFYPAPSGIAAFAEELAPYEHAKGSVRFPLDRPMPVRLIARIVRFRVREARGRMSARRARA